MKETIAAKIAELSFNQMLELFGFIVICAIVLLIGIAFAFDKLNVKSFNFHNGFTFYQDGEEKRTRITHRKKTVTSKRKVAK